MTERYPDDSPIPEVIPAAEFVNVDAEDLRLQETADELFDRRQRGEITYDQYDVAIDWLMQQRHTLQENARKKAGGRPGIKEIVRRWLNG